MLYIFIEGSAFDLLPSVNFPHINEPSEMGFYEPLVDTIQVFTDPKQAQAYRDSYVEFGVYERDLAPNYERMIGIADLLVYQIKLLIKNPSFINNVVKWRLQKALQTMIDHVNEDEMIIIKNPRFSLHGSPFNYNHETDQTRWWGEGIPC